ncbi:MAG: hypothetical protein H7288_02120 [Kineosporiaceae bacterium]|nr:hypothetical protein [Aeromicrobium sp.]
MNQDFIVTKEHRRFAEFVTVADPDGLLFSDAESRRPTLASNNLTTADLRAI